MVFPAYPQNGLAAGSGGGGNSGGVAHPGNSINLYRNIQPRAKVAAGSSKFTRTKMTIKRLTISIGIAALAAFSLHLVFVSQSTREPLPEPASMRQQPAPSELREKVLQNRMPTAEEGDKVDSGDSIAVEAEASSGLIEIFGRVADADGQPLENVLVNEERYFFSTRSDAQGYYRLVLDLPRHRLPVLQFLRSGYERLRIGDRAQMQQASNYELNVTLLDKPDSVSVAGWVGNDIGIGLDGASVELTAVEATPENDYSLTVFTDDRGDFELEGVGAGLRYRLSVDKIPDYPAYEIRELLVGAEPQRLNIVLPSLQFVEVDGMILNRDAMPVPNFEIEISNITTGNHNRQIVSDSSGFFTLRDYPLGEVSLTTRGNDIYRINGLRLTANGHRNLRLTIDRGNNMLTGWVSDQSGLPVNKALVTIERSFDDGAIEHLRYRSQASDANGWFSMENLGSGEYRVTVYAQGYRKHELLHRMSSQYEEIQIRLQPGGS